MSNETLSLKTVSQINLGRIISAYVGNAVILRIYQHKYGTLYEQLSYDKLFVLV